LLLLLELHFTDKWLRSLESETDSPDIMFASYTQLNVPAIVFTVFLVGMSMGALHAIFIYLMVDV
jgi:hypothetical protein